MTVAELRELLSDMPNDAVIMAVCPNDQQLVEINDAGWINERSCYVLYLDEGRSD